MALGLAFSDGSWIPAVELKAATLGQSFIHVRLFIGTGRETVARRSWEGNRGPDTK